MKIFEITSKDNEKIKYLRKLNQKKFRDKEGKFFVENFKIISDATNDKINFESLFVSQKFINSNKKPFKDFLIKSNIDKYYLINERVNKSFSNLETPSGICATYSKPDSKIDYSSPIIYLNAINDPGNLGTIIRSALSFSLANIIVDEKCADIFNFKTISASKNAIFKVNIEYDKNLNLLKKIKKKMPIFSAGLTKGSNIDKVSQKILFCLVLGNESNGVDKKILEMSDEVVTIKTSGKIESLNVASAGAILFYKIYRG